jgi:hypothetical protein
VFAPSLSLLPDSWSELELGTVFSKMGSRRCTVSVSGSESGARISPAVLMAAATSLAVMLLVLDLLLSFGAGVVTPDCERVLTLFVPGYRPVPGPGRDPPGS